MYFTEPLNGVLKQNFIKHVCPNRFSVKVSKRCLLYFHYNETQDPKEQENKESLGQEMVRRRLKHPDVLLVLLRIMKVLVETDEATEHLVKIN